MGGVSQVLVLAAAACGEIRANRIHSLSRPRDHRKQLGPGEPPSHLHDFGLDDFACGHERHEHDEILDARHTFSPKGDVADR